MKKILLVEDDDTLGATLSEKLQGEGYEVFWDQTLSGAQKHIDSIAFDVVIFDLGLPDGTGFDAAQALKERSKAPFLFVTAQTDAQTRLEAFELGAEEFIPKPFHIKELLMRLKHVLENHLPIRQIIYEHFLVDLDGLCLVFKSGERKVLVPRDFEILKFLIHKAPSVVSRDEILKKIWGVEEYPSTRTVDNSIVRIRQTLAPFSDEYLLSVRGVGYKWINNKGRQH